MWAVHSLAADGTGTRRIGNCYFKHNYQSAGLSVYQNVNAQPTKDPDTIKINLNKTINWRSALDANDETYDPGRRNSFIETGPGNVLQGLVKRLTET